MRSSTAALGSAAFFVVAPGSFVRRAAVDHPLVDPRVAARRFAWCWVSSSSWLGLILPAHVFVQFAGLVGHPRLRRPPNVVVTGFTDSSATRCTSALLTAMLGEALLFDSIALLVNAVIGWVAMASFVSGHRRTDSLDTYGNSTRSTAAMYRRGRRG